MPHWIEVASEQHNAMPKSTRGKFLLLLFSYNAKLNFFSQDYLLIALRSGIGMISLNSGDFMDVVLPINGVHGAVVLDFHYRKNLLFFADVNLDVIRRVNLLNLTESKVIVNTEVLTPNGIAVDWIADNLYWSDTDRKLIEVARIDGSSRKRIIEDNLGDPRSLIVHPKKAYEHIPYVIYKHFIYLLVILATCFGRIGALQQRSNVATWMVRTELSL